MTHSKVIGNQFEDLFKRQAQRAGFLVKKNELSARILWNGRAKLLKSELDWTIVNPEGRVGYFDTKSYGSDHFSFSQIDPKQIERAVLWNQWSVPAGFVVYFRPVNQIVFFSGRKIHVAGPRRSFSVKDGALLGRFELFDLKALMKA